MILLERSGIRLDQNQTRFHIMKTLVLSIGLAALLAPMSTSAADPDTGPVSTIDRYTKNTDLSETALAITLYIPNQGTYIEMQSSTELHFLKSVTIGFLDDHPDPIILQTFDMYPIGNDFDVLRVKSDMAVDWGDPVCTMSYNIAAITAPPAWAMLPMNNPRYIVTASAGVDLRL